MEENFFCKKEELFTFCELEFIKNALVIFEKSFENSEKISFAEKKSVSEVIQKITFVQKLVEESKNSMTVFFMPEENFKIFSLFNLSENSTSINKADVEKMLLAVEKFCENKKVRNHLEKKLKPLAALLCAQGEAFFCALKTDGFFKEF